MHAQYLSIALVAFASTALSLPVRNIHDEREALPEDVRTAIVMAGQHFHQVAARQADDVADLIAALPAGHCSEKRQDDFEYDAEACILAITICVSTHVLIF